MRAVTLVPVALLAAGAALVALAVAEGGAHVALVVIVPVVFGSSLAFLAGVLLLVAGVFSLPVALDVGEDTEPTEPSAGRAPTGGGTGGLVLIGPVPIFVGTWRNATTRTRFLVALAGAAALAAAVLFLLLARG